MIRIIIYYKSYEYEKKKIYIYTYIYIYIYKYIYIMKIWDYKTCININKSI